MATFRKTPAGKWRAELFKDGVRKSKTFPSKAEARDWAARAEYEMANGQTVAGAGRFRDLLERYAREVSPKKRGHKWEDIRLAKIGRDKIGDVRLRDLRPFDFSDWRDRRLNEVKPASVKREMNLLSAVLSVARDEWGVISDSPMAGVRKPPSSQPRDRRPSDLELEALAIAAGDNLTKAQARAFHAFKFAIETGMRAGEIVGLTWECIDLESRVAFLPITKNYTARRVPLSSEAVRLLEALPVSDPVFGLRSANLDVLWRKARDRAAVVGLTFHDSRHEAITRLSKKLDVLALAKMVGHRDIKMLMVYYDETAEELARRLD